MCKKQFTYHHNFEYKLQIEAHSANHESILVTVVFVVVLIDKLTTSLVVSLAFSPSSILNLIALQK